MNLRMAALAASLVLIVLVSLIGAQPASAHAQLLGTYPASNEQLDAAPLELRAWFNESINPAGEAFRLVNASGVQLALEDIGLGADAKTLRAVIPAPLPDGTYAVTWAIISEDGHTVRGSFVFAVGVALDPSLAPPRLASTPAWVSVVAMVARAVAYIAGMFVIGVLMMGTSSYAARQAPFFRRTLALGAALLLFAGPVVTVGEGLNATTGSLSRLFEESTGELLWYGRHIPSLLILSAGSLTALLIARVAMPPLRIFQALSCGAVLAIGLGFAWAGHPAADQPRWLGISLNGAHMAAAGTWAGGIVFLVLARRHPSDLGRDFVVAFSRMAMVAFPVAVVTGAILTLRVLPELSALLDTGYGRLILTKVGFVIVIAALAAINRWRLLPAFGSEASQTLLHRFLAIEVAASIAITLATATLTGQSPSGSVSQARPVSPSTAPSAADSFLKDFHATLVVTPGAIGLNDFVATFHYSGPGVAMDPQSVELQLTHNETQTGPLRVVLEPKGPGRFESIGQRMPLAGNWTVILVVRISDFEQERQTLEIGIR